MIFISAGFDAHREDDLGQMGLVEDDYAWITRQLVALAFFRGLAHAEIAAHARLPLGTVKSRISRGRARLREILRADPAGRDLGSISQEKLDRAAADRSGGRIYHADTLYSVSSAFTQIAEELRQRFKEIISGFLRAHPRAAEQIVFRGVAQRRERKQTFAHEPVQSRPAASQSRQPWLDHVRQRQVERLRGRPAAEIELRDEVRVRLAQAQRQRRGHQVLAALDEDVGEAAFCDEPVLVHEHDFECTRGRTRLVVEVPRGGFVPQAKVLARN